MSSAFESTSVDVLVQQALVLHQQGRLGEARPLYEQALSIEPDDFEALQLLGALCAQSQQYVQALDLLSNALRLKPDHAVCYNNRGFALKELKRFDEALSSYDAALALKPNYADAHNNRAVVLQELRQFDEALESYEAAVLLNPDNPSRYYNRGNAFQNLKRTTEALESYDRAIALDPQYADAYNNRGNALKELRRLTEALASYEQALRLKPEYVDAHNNRGVTLQELGRFDEGLASYDRALALNPEYVDAYNNRGTILQELKRHDEALASYDQGIALRPNDAAVYSNRGNVLTDMERLVEALASYDKALELAPDYAQAHNNKGIALQKLGRLNEALDCFARAIEIQADYADFYYNRGNTLQKLKRCEDALKSYDKAIALNPDYAAAYNNRGNSLEELRRLGDALASYDKAIALKPEYAAAYNNRGFVLKDLKRVEETLLSFEQALRLKPDYDFLPGMVQHIKMFMCDWRGFDEGVLKILEKIQRNEKASAPFLLLALSDAPLIHRLCSQIFFEQNSPLNHSLGAIPKRDKKNKIHIGYFSTDFRNHPMSFLTAELFELHDAKQFEITAIALGPASQDPIRTRLKKAFHRFIEVRDQSDYEVAKLSRELGIDIAVDLNGFTTGARTSIFSYRAAPIQVNYLGYPGTMAANYIDYIVADRTLVPASSRDHYSEKIVYMPGSYMANDRKRVISERHFTRQELGLPDNAFVFACFNNNFKITPKTFECWMRILKSVAQSVLWLFEDNPIAVVNLKKEAQQRGVHPDRLVFAKRMPLEEHLARHRQADLFIDTLPYNAHTTASDALWAGLPVVTLIGDAFASRVAASLLNAIDLPELIANTPAEYEALAIELATHPKKLQAIREKLARHRMTKPLFDAPAFTKSLEAAYTKMMERYWADLPPDHLFIDSSPLDVKQLLKQALALHQLGKFAEAQPLYVQALNLEPNSFETLQLLGALAAQTKQFTYAVELLSKALQLNASHAVVHNNLGFALKELNRLDEALIYHDKALELNGDFAEAHNNRGAALMDLKRFDEALVSFTRAIELNQRFAEAHSNLGNTLRELKRLDQALVSYERAIALRPNYELLFGTILHTKMRICDWNGFEQKNEQLIALVQNKQTLATPFSMLALTDSPKLQRQNTENFVNTRYPYKSVLGPLSKRLKGGKIRVGYFSSDFTNHPVSILTAELYELHDRSRFEMVAFSLQAAAPDDPMRQRIAKAFDRFIDVDNQSDQEIAQLSRSLGIDIAVDLGGHTQFARTGIFACRAAPVQVNYLGYPGTMGAQYIDYIVADHTVIPVAARQHYTEKIVYMPKSYMAQDRKRIISDRKFTRQELGLPEDAFVFACLNNNYKITPTIFDSWMRILKTVSGSVLWLKETNSFVTANLKNESTSRGVDPNRLIFASNMPLPEDHLARYCHADLFIDTLPFNAHTTASDALWAGLPVLTLQGESFAGRVAASLLNAIHLPELITHTQLEYETTAIKLATQPELLAKTRQQLMTHRLTTPLFDTPAFTRALEEAYNLMMERYWADLPPEHLYVEAASPDVTQTPPLSSNQT